MNLNDLRNVADGLGATAPMPVLFIGHGSPMNAILDNPFTRALTRMGEGVETRPNAILVVSAHWLTRGTAVATTAKPETIHDFGGFPEELYKVVYPAPGSPEYAREVKRLIPEAVEDSEWGLDHGSWTVLKHLFPGADIPVFQISIDYYRPMSYHFDLAARLKELRRKGVLVIGSGNIVHNLRLWFAKRDQSPYDWNVEFDTWVKGRIDDGDFKSLVDYESQGSVARLAVPTVDHYVPLIYTLALAEPGEKIVHTYEELISGGSMRSFRIG